MALTTGLLAIRLDRRSALFRTLRLNGVVAIGVTGVVFHLALAQLQELTRWDALADAILHTVSPILAVTGWLVFGPRGALSRRIVLLAVIAPVVWIAYALVRGVIVKDRFGNDYYPYPFMNVQEHGYAVVLVNVTILAVLFLIISFGALAMDRHLRGVRNDAGIGPAGPPSSDLSDSGAAITG